MSGIAVCSHIKNFAFIFIILVGCSQLTASPSSSTTLVSDQLLTLLKNYATCWHTNDIPTLMDLHVRSSPILLIGPGEKDRGTTLLDIHSLYTGWLKALNSDSPIGVTINNPTVISGPDNDTGVVSAEFVLKGTTSQKSPLSAHGPLRLSLFVINVHGEWLIRQAHLSLSYTPQACPSCPICPTQTKLADKLKAKIDSPTPSGKDKTPKAKKKKTSPKAAEHEPDNPAKKNPKL